MAEKFPVIYGVMACRDCGMVRAILAHHVRDFKWNDGQSWEHCPSCGQWHWFVPFDPMPKAAEPANNVTAGVTRPADGSEAA